MFISCFVHYQTHTSAFMSCYVRSAFPNLSEMVVEWNYHMQPSIFRSRVRVFKTNKLKTDSNYKAYALLSLKERRFLREKCQMF